MAVVVEGSGFEEDRHEAMLSAAQFRALAIVAAIAKDEEVGLVQAARNGITFEG